MTEEEKIATAIGLFASVIKSGEGWTEACETAKREAYEALDRLAVEIKALREFRDQFNAVYDDAWKLAQEIVKHHIDSPAIFGLQPDHRFRETASPLDVAADLAKAISAARVVDRNGPPRPFCPVNV